MVATAYDGAGRIQQVNNAATATRYGEVSEYAEHGAIKTLKLGGPNTGTEVMQETWAFNNRLQPTETRLRAAGSAQNLLSLQYFYCASQAASCTNNNGNMRSQSIGYDAVGGEAAAFTISQAYGYDKLNRLTTFTEGATSETNNYDSWGNRWATSSGLLVDNLTPNNAGWFNQTNDNRMFGVGYDAVGRAEQVRQGVLRKDSLERRSRL